MTEKNALAQILDKLAESMTKKKDEAGGDDLNILPKPGVQEIGDGIIVWRWFSSGVVVETTLATRHSNQMNLEPGTYLISMKMPESSNATYCFYEDSAKEIGQMLLSAWNWQNVWKIHAGDFLLNELSKEPAVEYVEPEIIDVEEDVSGNV